MVPTTNNQQGFNINKWWVPKNNSKNKVNEGFINKNNSNEKCNYW